MRNTCHFLGKRCWCHHSPRQGVKRSEWQPMFVAVIYCCFRFKFRLSSLQILWTPWIFVGKTSNFEAHQHISAHLLRRYPNCPSSELDSTSRSLFGPKFLLQSSAKSLETNLGGGFKYCICSSLLGEDSHFDQYFSNGLKPPTSNVFLRENWDRASFLLKSKVNLLLLYHDHYQY